MNSSSAFIQMRVEVNVGRMGYDSSGLQETGGQFTVVGHSMGRSLLKPAQDAPTRTW